MGGGREPVQIGDRGGRWDPSVPEAPIGPWFEMMPAAVLAVIVTVVNVAGEVETMASFDVRSLSALEVLDSRGRPTVAVSIALADGSTSSSGVPSGASTGTREAAELRDGNPTRFGGAGVLRAVGNVQR